MWKIPDLQCSLVDTVFVGDLRVYPISVLGDTSYIECVSGTALLDARGSSYGSEFDYQWSTPNGSFMGGTDGQLAETDDRGVYYLSIENRANGCWTYDTTVVEDQPRPYDIDLVAYPTCKSENTGRIEIEQVYGGSGPYLFSLDGNPLVYTDEFINLTPETHELLIEDVNGCTYEETLWVDERDQMTVSLGEPISIKMGDTATLNPILSIDSSEVQSLQWQPAEYLNCDDCWTPTTDELFQTLEVRVTVTDTLGCEGVGRTHVFVSTKAEVYIPNVFSPNGDNTHDFFTVYGGENVATVKQMRIFTRWGAMTFEKYNFLPNVEQEGWDGRYRGTPVNPGVYVYFVEVELINGKTEIFKGDVTVLR